MRVQALATVFMMIIAASAAAEGQAVTRWKDHVIRQGDSQGGWVARPAQRQVLKQPDSKHTMPFGLVRMDNGEIVLICSWERQGKPWLPIIAFSRDGGDTWTDFRTVPGVTGRPMNLTYHGGGKLSFVTGHRDFSHDYGRTWEESVEHPPASNGRPFHLEGNAWVDRDEGGRAQTILEVGDFHVPGKKTFGDGWITGVFRRSLDGGRTWQDEVVPPAWKTSVEHDGRQWSRGVAEGAIVRAANGDLVAALRTDMHPKFLDGPHDDSLMGTAISISHDNGKTWSPMRQIAEEGRHHANLQRLPNGDLVCTLIVRDDIQGGKLASHRRGCDALVSKDHGKSWNLDRRYELDGFNFARKDGYWVDGKCGHVASVALPDGHVISAYGDYRQAAAVLIKWRPDSGPAIVAPKVSVQIGRKATRLEHYAANELAGYVEKLFHIDARPTTETASAEIRLLIGSPDSNPAIAKALGAEAWPEISDQGIVLKKAKLDGTPALIVGGGSDAATLWAVYELVEQWGVHYLLHGDVLPEKLGRFTLPAEDIVLEPKLRVRQWRVINDFACGPESWGMADYRPVLDQLAKLKFNRIFVSIYPWQPFLDLEVDGIKRKTGTLWYKYRYPITDDMPGRHLFGDTREFWNPDLPLGASYDELAAAGERLVHNVMDYAHRRGMQCVLVTTLTRFPPEFAPLLKDVRKVHQLAGLTIVPGADTELTDPGLTKLADAVLRTTIDTYPEADFVSLGMPEMRQWAERYEDAWHALDAKYRLNDVLPLETILARAGKRTGYPGGANRAVQEVKGDIVALHFYDRLLSSVAFRSAKAASGRNFRGAKGDDVKFIFNSVAEELFPVLPRVLPPHSEALNFVDYTASRIVRRREVLKTIPSREVPCVLIYTLHDDNVGVLPQLTTGSLHELTKDLRRHGWAGFSTRYWLVADHDPCLAYLARASWDTAVTPESAYRDQVHCACGELAVADMLEMFRELERVTITLEQHGLGLTFPVPGMIMKHWTPRDMPAKLLEARCGYQQALAAARRARARSTAHGHGYVGYWIGRLEFGIGYLHTIEVVRAAAVAEKDNKYDEAVQHAETALTKASGALEAYARVARDQSDRGAIATMAEYVYRPIRDKRNELKKRMRD